MKYSEFKIGDEVIIRGNKTSYYWDMTFKSKSSFSGVIKDIIKYRSENSPGEAYIETDVNTSFERSGQLLFTKEDGKFMGWVPLPFLIGNHDDSYEIY